MTPEKREELKLKRVLLQEEIALKLIRDRVRTQLNYLDQQNYPYTIYYNHEHLLWIMTNIQVRKRDGYNGMYDDFQIDTTDLAKKKDVSYDEIEAESTQFRALFLAILSDDERLIVCYEGGGPEIEISAEALLSRPTEFFCRPETWILSKNREWIIEYIWDHGVIRFFLLKNGKPTLIQRIIVK